MRSGDEAVGRGFFDELVQTSPEAVWVLTLQGRTVYGNARLAELYDLASDELLELQLHDALDESARAWLGTAIERLHRDERVEAEEIALVCPDGSNAWVLLQPRLVRRDDGALLALTISDYTTWHEEKERLAAAKEDLDLKILQYELTRAVASEANQASSLVEILARGRDLLLVIEEWNRAVGFLVGEGGQLSRVHPDDADRALAAQEDAADPDRIAQERALALKAASSAELEWNDGRNVLAFPIRHEGRVHAVAVITADPVLEDYESITENARMVMYQLEAVLAREEVERATSEARDQAILASRQKSEFLATVSHEIRTPLNGVLGLNELLMDTDLDEQQAGLAAGIKQSGEMLMSLINDVLDFSKIEAGRMRLERVAFDVRTVINDVLAPFHVTAESMGLSLSCEYADSVPPVATGDPVRVSQVISNLISNAVKFTESGGVRVAVSSRPDNDGHLLRVVVHDTGIGIQASGSDLFAPFQQGDSSTTRLFGGSGLGLAISRELVAAMGGEIGFDSQPGSGSTFWFTTPLGAASDAAPEVGADDVLAEPSPSCHVLVVEDNEINQLVAKGMLAAIGHTADVAATGYEAIDMVGLATYDVIFMDVQMPGLDGYETTRALRMTQVGADVPIVAMTANALAGERERCLAAGMDDYVTKPVSRRALEAAIGRVLHHRVVSGHVEPEADPDAVLDRARLDELRDMGEGDVTYLERVLDRFGSGSKDSLDRIAAALAAENAEELAFHAHKLVGTAANLGLVQVTRLARSMEEIGRSGEAAGAKALLPVLADSLEGARQALDGYRGALHATPAANGLGDAE